MAKATKAREALTPPATPNTGRVTALFAKIVNKHAERGEYELELMGGNRVTIDVREVEKIEEHIDPVTGIPVAKITLDEESDLNLTSVIKARDLGQSANTPFVFGGPALTSLPGVGGPALTPLPGGPLPPSPSNPIPLPGGRFPGPRPLPPTPIWRPGEPFMNGTECMYNSDTYCKTLFGYAHDDSGGGDTSYDD